MLDAETEIASLRADARFVTIRGQVQRNADPCGASEHRAFDFWVGEWQVFVGGQHIADSSIQNILNGCVIFENWMPLGGAGGKSFNYYDATMKKWRQLWVASSPGSIEFTGEVRDGNMYYTSDRVLPNGTRQLGKMTFFALGPDKVRQFWETSSDGGKTWTVAFDGEYRRKK
jgi:hypothetical protein